MNNPPPLFHYFIFSCEILVRQSAESFYNLYLVRVVRSVAGAVQVVEPLRKVAFEIRILFVVLPDAVPWLEGLVFSCHKSPVVASDLLKEEQREQLLHVIVEAPRKPFRAYYRSSVFAQLCYQLYMVFVT